MSATITVSHATTRSETNAGTAKISLEGLLRLDVQALEKLYVGGRVPSLADVKGDLRGRMLATTLLRGTAARWVGALAASHGFPWRGKTFAPENALRGGGINRVIRDRWHLYRFETSIGPSRAGDFDALQLDYDNRDNPFFIRPIKDEMRELAPGLWLGQAWLQLPSASHLVLYFGLAR